MAQGQIKIPPPFEDLWRRCLLKVVSHYPLTVWVDVKTSGSPSCTRSMVIGHCNFKVSELKHTNSCQVLSRERDGKSANFGTQDPKVWTSMVSNEKRTPSKCVQTGNDLVPFSEQFLMTRSGSTTTNGPTQVATWYTSKACGFKSVMTSQIRSSPAILISIYQDIIIVYTVADCTPV